jgi:hypothetical protein
MDPNISKATTGKERVVGGCAESQSTSRGPNRTRFLAVQVAIRVKMQCDKKSFLAVVDASKKRNLMVVGGHADNAVDLCGEDNADSKRQCLGKGQNMPTNPPTQDGETPRQGTDYSDETTEPIRRNSIWLPCNNERAHDQHQENLAGVCQSYLNDITFCTTLSNSTDNIVCTVSF